MDVSRVGQIQGAGPQQPDRSKPAQKQKVAQSTDRVEISAAAKKANKTTAQPYVNLAKEALDIRQEKVNEVRQRLFSGEYATREASKKAAESIVDDILR